VKTPNCPACGRPPELALHEQSFCGNDDCEVLIWNPTKDGEEQLRNAERIDEKGNVVSEMLRATGVYVILAENETGQSTVKVVGSEGPYGEGDVPFTDVRQPEEGILSFIVPSINAWMTMVSLEVPGSESHPNVLQHLRREAKKLANKSGKRFELVFFGPNGREHKGWLG